MQDNAGKLKIVKTSNADLPVTDGLNPLLVIDVWEHAVGGLSCVASRPCRVKAHVHQS